MKEFLPHTLTKSIKFTIIAATFALVSCSSSINIKSYIDQNSPFDLTINKRDVTKGLTKSTESKIVVNSDKYLKLIDWLDKNENGWRATPTSFSTDILVTQNSFRLLYNIAGEDVVIGVADKQYLKAIKKGELDFLLK